MDNTAIKVRRPVLRYHGGKFRLAKWIISHFPKHRIYCEPFGGAGSVLMLKNRSLAEIYNDLDGEIVNVFRVLQNPNHAAELERLIRLTPFARDEFKLSYELSSFAIEQARRTIIRSFMGFGSDGVNDARPTGFRSTSKRSSNTPTHNWADYPDEIKAFIQRLQGVTIENTDFERLIANHDSLETLFYLDPPYVHSTRTNSKRYRHEFTDADHRRLAEMLKSIKGKAIVSGYSCPLYDELYSTCRTSTKPTFASGARPRTETLWMSF